MIDYDRDFLFFQARSQHSVFILNYSICVCIKFAINFLALHSCDLSDLRHSIFSFQTSLARPISIMFTSKFITLSILDVREGDIFSLNGSQFSHGKLFEK